jgi:hydrogenase nickel incorporation protein HypA/HybF
MRGMHEAAIVRSIIEIAEREARSHGATRIGRIGVRIGAFRGVVAAALDFSFEVLRVGTLVAEGRLEVETIPLRLGCVECGEYECELGELSFYCRECGGGVEIRSGRELEVAYLELD